MKKRKSFSRFILWILFVLEGLSLAMVIGFLYAMLNHAITQEYRHQTQMQIAEVQSLLIQRRLYAQARIDEISTNNGLGVCLLLGMLDKAEDLMQQSYPPSNGASFFLRHPSGAVVPSPLMEPAVWDNLDKTISENPLPRQIEITPWMMALSQPVESNGKILGQVIGVYSITDDPVVAAKMDGCRNICLVAHIGSRQLNLGSALRFKNIESPNKCGLGTPVAMTAQTFQDEKLPLEGLENLFVTVSDAPLAKKRRNLIFYLILLCLPLLGLTLSVSFLILKKVTSSINALACNAVAIADDASPQNLDEEQVQHEEFLHLAQAFNKVLSKFRKRTREVQRHQNHLDQLVQERTAELHASNQKLKKTQAQMIQSEKMASIGQLAAGVAHEINNPIGFINSNLYSIKEYCQEINGLLVHYEKLESVVGADTQDQSPIAGMLEEIRHCKETMDYDYVKKELDCALDESREGVERVTCIVKDLKDFSHADSGTVEYADINHGIESTLNIVWNQLKYNATVNKDLGELPMVKCDLNKMNQVFMNLLINAGQAVECNGLINIRTRCIDKLVEIVIKDNGCGIPPEILPKIFDPFFTTKEVGCGTGLGLNMVYNIVNSHNGSIEVESEVGKGTTFTVRLDIDGGKIHC